MHVYLLKYVEGKTTGFQQIELQRKRRLSQNQGRPAPDLPEKVFGYKEEAIAGSSQSVNRTEKRVTQKRYKDTYLPAIEKNQRASGKRIF